MWNSWITSSTSIPAQQPHPYYHYMPMAPPLPTGQPPPLPPGNSQTCNSSYNPYQPPPTNTTNTSTASPFIGPLLPNGGATLSPMDTYPNNALYPSPMALDQQNAWQHHYYQWHQYQQEYAKWHKQYGEQYQRDLEAVAASTGQNAYNYQQQHQPPVVEKVIGPTPARVTAKPHMYQKPPQFNYSCPPPAVPINQSLPIITQPPPILFLDNQKSVNNNENLNHLPPFNRPPPLLTTNNVSNNARFSCGSIPNIANNTDNTNSQIGISQRSFKTNENIHQTNNNINYCESNTSNMSKINIESNKTTFRSYLNPRGNRNSLNINQPICNNPTSNSSTTEIISGNISNLNTNLQNNNNINSGYTFSSEQQHKSLQKKVINKDSAMSIKSASGSKTNPVLSPMVDEDQFDRYFQQWEEKFEEWKRANINHPDKAVYLRYLNEFENQRQRIISRREQLKIRRLLHQQNQEQLQKMLHQQNSGNVMHNKNVNSCSSNNVNLRLEMSADRSDPKLSEPKQREDDLNDSKNDKENFLSNEKEPLEQNKIFKIDDINSTESELNATQMGKQNVDDNQPEILNLFPKPDGIPGLDLVKTSELSENDNSQNVEGNTETLQNQLETSEKIQNLENAEQDTSEELVNSLNDPIFLKQISDAIATIKNKESPSLSSKRLLLNVQKHNSSLLMPQLFTTNSECPINEINNIIKNNAILGQNNVKNMNNNMNFYKINNNKTNISVNGNNVVPCFTGRFNGEGQPILNNLNLNQKISCNSQQFIQNLHHNNGPTQITNVSKVFNKIAESPLEQNLGYQLNQSGSNKFNVNHSNKKPARKRRRRPRHKSKQKANNDTKEKTTGNNNNNEKNLTLGIDDLTEPISSDGNSLEEISDTDSILDRVDYNKNECLSNKNKFTERESSMPHTPPPPPILSESDHIFFTSDSQNICDYTCPQLMSTYAVTPNQFTSKINEKSIEISIPSAENHNTISVMEFLENPGRLTRPKKICIIIRGPPGSGKSYVARLIKDKERNMGDANLRILSIDDYFLVETETVEKCSKTGKKVTKKNMIYEYDEQMEDTYTQYLIKSFKKTISNNLYDFIIIDCNNNSLRTLNEFYCHAKDNGFKPYIIDMFCDLETCLSRNYHKRDRKHIEEIIKAWNPTPLHYIKLDIVSLLENVIEMQDAEDMVLEKNDVMDKDLRLDNRTNSIDAHSSENKKILAQENQQNDFVKSKWETDQSIENLERLDGTNKLMMKRKLSIEDYLQMDDWEEKCESNDRKKRIRWADIEEKRNQDKMRAIGFVIGQTDWKRMMDPNAALQALNKTKYIDSVNVKNQDKLITKKQIKKYKSINTKKK